MQTPRADQESTASGSTLITASKASPASSYFFSAIRSMPMLCCWFRLAAPALAATRAAKLDAIVPAPLDDVDAVNLDALEASDESCDCANGARLAPKPFLPVFFFLLFFFLASMSILMGVVAEVLDGRAANCGSMAAWHVVARAANATAMNDDVIFISPIGDARRARPTRKCCGRLKGYF